MKSLFEYMPFRSCPVCSRVLFEQVWLCTGCHRELKQYLDLALSRGKKLQLRSLSSKETLEARHFYLWESMPINEDYLSAFIQSLKGGFPAFALKLWIENWICSGLGERSLDLSNSIFIPAPPSKMGQKDHAWCLAQSLGQKLGVPVMTVLQRNTSGIKQKFQSRKEREKLQLESILGRVSQATLKRMQVHFVDDVVTTGSTASAAWRALGRPPNFYVWSLIYRSRLLT